MRYLFLLSLLVLLFGCLSPSSDVRATLGEPFSLKINETAYIQSENLLIEFAEVEGDSRCPSDVLCVWEGIATVEVRGNRSGGGSFDITLSTQEPSQNVNIPQGGTLTVGMVGLAPYPKVSEPISPEEYVLTMKVTKE